MPVDCRAGPLALRAQRGYDFRRTAISPPHRWRDAGIETVEPSSRRNDAIMDKLLGCYLWGGFIGTGILLFAGMFGWDAVIIMAATLAVFTIAAFAWATWKRCHP